MEKFSVDVLVIGFGKGGKMAAVAQAKAGKQVVLIEESPQMYGGTCINVGCVPTKILVAEAEKYASNGALAAATDSAQAPAAQAFTQAIGRKDTLTGAMRGKNFAMLDGLENARVITGHGTFVGPDTVEVTDQEGTTYQISAQVILVNTGARPVIPPIPGVKDTPGIYDTEGIQRLPELPASLAIVGGGPIGLEFASIFAKYGTEVTVLEGAPTFLPREDRDVAEALLQVLTKQGIKVLTNVKVEAFAPVEGRPQLSYTDGQGLRNDLQADAVLLAVGRRPNTDDLGLETAGIATTERGAIQVDEYLRTTNERVYALGDVNGGPQFTYISLDDLRIVREQLNPPADRAPRSTRDRVAVPTAIFTTPPLARVGLTEGEAVAQGRLVRVVTRAADTLAATPKVRIAGDPDGYIKFVLDAQSDEILGAAVFMTESAEVINLIALAIRANLPYTALRDGIWTHPSATEMLNEVLS